MVQISYIITTAGVMFVILLVIILVSGMTLKDKLQLIFSLMLAISIFFAVYNAYINTVYRKEDTDNRIAYDTLRNVDELWLKPQRELLANFPEGYFLYEDLNPDFKVANTPPMVYDKAKRDMLETVYANVIIQNIENYQSIAKFDTSGETGRLVWLVTFIRAMSSPIMQKRWNEIRASYDIDTQSLIDDLIEKGNELKSIINSGIPVTYDTYLDLAKRVNFKPR